MQGTTRAQAIVELAPALPAPFWRALHPHRPPPAHHRVPKCCRARLWAPMAAAQQWRQALALLARGVGSPGLAPAGALSARCREVCTSAVARHVQPAEAEPPHADTLQPRWLRELGVVRTDWT